jgi:hypothetical protein
MILPPAGNKASRWDFVPETTTDGTSIRAPCRDNAVSGTQPRWLASISMRE